MAESSHERGPSRQLRRGEPHDGPVFGTVRRGYQAYQLVSVTFIFIDYFSRLILVGVKLI